MKLTKCYKEVKFLGLLNNIPVLQYKDHMDIDNLSIELSPSDDFCIMNDILQGKKDGKKVFFVDGNFSEFPPTRYEERVMWTLKDSKSFDGNKFRLSFFFDGEEYLFETESKEHLAVINCLSGKNKDILLLSSYKEDSYLFYALNGSFLWKYIEQEENLKVNWRCIPIVDDVVVIISCNITIALKVQGFNIRTGEQLWILDVSECVCPNTFFVGDDKMLYGCDCYYGDTTDLHLCKLDPFTGKLESWNVLTDEDLDICPWLVTMHNRKLYYADNRRGNEIGVIDIDKKEIIERVSLNIDKKITIGAPEVTDEVYIFIRELQELRVYEK